MSEYNFSRFIYWVPADLIDQIKTKLNQQGYRFFSPLGSQCEVLKTNGDKLGYAAPEHFSRLCKRQGSWYRSSEKFGLHAIASDHRLADEMSRFLDAEMTSSTFMPDSLPGNRELMQLVESTEYQSQRPDEWEKPGVFDNILFKTMFTFTGFWGWGDNLKSTWLNHRANHANFLSKTFTTEIDGERVPYTVSENSDVCSSCVEFLNIVSGDSRKLVRACPGSITMTGAKRDVYYEIKPVRHESC